MTILRIKWKGVLVLEFPGGRIVKPKMGDHGKSGKLPPRTGRPAAFWRHRGLGRMATGLSLCVRSPALWSSEEFLLLLEMGLDPVVVRRYLHAVLECGGWLLGRNLVPKWNSA